MITKKQKRARDRKPFQCTKCGSKEHHCLTSVFDNEFHYKKEPIHSLCPECLKKYGI